MFKPFVIGKCVIAGRSYYEAAGFYLFEVAGLYCVTHGSEDAVRPLEDSSGELLYPLNPKLFKQLADLTEPCVLFRIEEGVGHDTQRD